MHGIAKMLQAFLSRKCIQREASYKTLQPSFGTTGPESPKELALKDSCSGFLRGTDACLQVAAGRGLALRFRCPLAPTHKLFWHTYF